MYEVRARLKKAVDWDSTYHAIDRRWDGIAVDIELLNIAEGSQPFECLLSRFDEPLLQ